MNYALAQMYNSGALCLGITADALGDAVPLTTALVGFGLVAVVDLESDRGCGISTPARFSLS